MTTAAHDSRYDEIVALLTAGDPQSSFLDRVCVVATGLLGVSGTGMCVVVGAHDEVLVRGTDQVAEELENLQVSLAQGPCLEAMRTGSPVIVGDLEHLAGSDWHRYRESALAIGARAVFCLPLQIHPMPPLDPTLPPDPGRPERTTAGTVQIGALDLYRTTAGDFEPDQLADALLLADIATRSILGQQAVDLTVGQVLPDPGA